MYDVSLSIHVLAAVVGFGATFTYPLIELAGRRAGNEMIPRALEIVLLISRRLAVPAALVVGATGTYQLLEGPFELSDAWLSISVALYVAVMIVAAVVVAPAYERARASAVRSLGAGEQVEESAEYAAARRVIVALGPALALAISAIVVLMVTKPG